MSYYSEHKQERLAYQKAYNKRKRPALIIDCELCGKQFNARSKTSKYCCKSCRWRADKDRRGPEPYGKYLCRKSATCLHCNKTFRPKEPNCDTYCSVECCKAHRGILKYERQIKSAMSAQWFDWCADCKKILFTKTRRCPDCSKKHRNKSAVAKIKAKRTPVQKLLPCRLCGQMTITNKRHQYCSNTCKKIYIRHSNKIQTGVNTTRRKARKHANGYERISRIKVYKRDNWTCGICGKRVDRRCKFPHPNSPSIDHKIALASGGSHTYDNVQCAHFYCNSIKGAN